jgi:hypothetical protein
MYDVIVLGSGAAGLTAAFTAAHEGARVAVFEKHDRIGGTSAWSGGHVWIPGNPHMAGIGAADGPEEAMAYLMSLGRGIVDERLVRAFVENGPRMAAYLEKHGGVAFFAVPGLPDYYPSNPGGKPGGGRTMGIELFSFQRLGEWRDRVEPCPYYPSDFRMDETGIGATVPKPPSAQERSRRQANDERGMGQSLVGLLLAACLREGVTIETAAPAADLLRDGGRVTGVVLGGGRKVRAARGVVLATGGFEWNPEYCATFLRGVVGMPVSIPTNTGDGLRMAMRAGAALQNMREAWWIPAAKLPPGVNPMNREMINGDRTRPRSILINRAGRRFTNEAVNYNGIGGAFHQEDVNTFGYANLPAWLIFDHTYLVRYGSIGRPYAGETPPWLVEAASIEALASRLGVPPAELRATVDRWNAHVAAGADPDFHRGETAHDLWWGDPYKKGSIEGTLGPLDTPPFYALELTIGALGTKGGPKVDADARVVDLDGKVIPGLYAAGNTLGPGMTFGWLAGRHIASA